MQLLFFAVLAVGSASGAQVCSGFKKHSVFVPHSSCDGADSVEQAETLNCFLREFDPVKGELRTAESAEACEERCKNHVPPRFRQKCRHWSWGARGKGSKYHQRCLMTTHMAEEMDDRRFASGSCQKGAGKEDNMTNEFESQDKAFCAKIMESVDSLRVWLAVEHRMKLPDNNLKDLHIYMTIQSMCVSDPGFEKALSAFLPPPPHKDTLFEKAINLGFLIQKNMNTIVAVAGAAGATLAPILIPVAQKGLGVLKRAAPTLEKSLESKLPKELQTKGE